MNKKFCDWCEVEISENQKEVSVEGIGIFCGKEDLCFKCVKEVEKIKKQIKKKQ